MLRLLIAGALWASSPMSPDPRNPKLAGERAESAFMTAALERGLIVSRPFGESVGYDFIVDNRRLRPAGERSRLWRVQVRSVSGLPPFRVTTFHGSHKRPLTAADADFLAVLIVPLHAWYIIPVDAFAPALGLWLFPHVPASRGRYEKYRAAWPLLF
jgi:PD-(D/E)XK nuclease superfamily protein